ncbi:hypothetical protein FEAC_21790 [Ferrimicrobium acidiphilum DSM 19497]|jgi:hypothetical protein|uniref:Uncharacterized protein n=1 Tax=Ferrimicrobium acidiphilum DSM 19497 TaxID=1121877 RepID=A0A0D8FS29_9ACTN|nr:hypothetical protein FEAC_21790 [Ferrimicrobium acidiphilum DSM 19497]
MVVAEFPMTPALRVAAKLSGCYFGLWLGATPLGSSNRSTIWSSPLQEGTPLVTVAVDTPLAECPTT